MQNINEGDSVTINNDSFSVNGKIGKVLTVNEAGNRCSVILEDGSTHVVSLNEVTIRRFLTES